MYSFWWSGGGGWGEEVTTQKASLQEQKTKKLMEQNTLEHNEKALFRDAILKTFLFRKITLHISVRR